jgi:hypothetical protein
MADSTTFVFRCGVARFDASNNLFVHLTHSPEAPAPAQVAGLSVQAPADQRRGQVTGDGDMTPTGEIPGVADLPRGYLVDLRGYDTAEYADGAITVTYSSVSSCPDWLKAGAENVFAHDAEKLRLWAKSALPEGVSLGEAGRDAKASVRTQGNRAPTLSDAAETPAEPPPAAAPKADDTPYTPDRRPAGAFETGAKKSGGLGCSTLMLAAALVTVLAAIV